MRKVLIVGAGQSGLQLALSLQEHDYDVTVMSARTPDEIRAGRVLSTQCMFADALAVERAHGLNLWDDVAPRIAGQGLSLGAPDGTRMLNWISAWDNGPAQSIDQRVKMPAWLELFEDRGGKVVIHGVTTSDLNGLASLYELTIVAAGKGELVQLFTRDASRSPFTAPQRALSVSYVHGVESRPDRPGSTDVWMNIVPGVCELINIPGYTLSGPCDIFYVSGAPGGPFDCFADRPGPSEHLARHLELFRQYLPWEYERCRNAELTDARATLVGGYAPVVRHPVGELPSGQFVLGMADVVVANDPITGQGANNAAKCAEAYLRAILEHGDQPFDRAWMQRTFDRYWEHAQYVTRFTNTMLHPPEHVQAILGAAQTNEAVAKRFVNGFNNPTDFQHWLLDPQKTQDYLVSVGAAG
ncbi:styrene monooxygenase/indole monooxygenase family protein [Goodfellowiella coeruleoviolacea]|uniref:2-polyprenyl-6-methoxyphenol hydroxylase n=1 Tax=Goodfellowiella coeruleoviolacea TaxID=334858 RepID=A0AAE3GI25_9PSEU|nr:styrene monooxygenase/indole monooxygenase family protein [Goodfellowiella coeruleoviolacea]MCP2168602.1 2-polyprenyl-6-methoxyphenol hydroxylase [Goodfellowiella coeruleoviolacea]